MVSNLRNPRIPDRERYLDRFRRTGDEPGDISAWRKQAVTEGYDVIKLLNEQIKQATFIKAPATKIYDVITSGAGWNAFFTHATEVDPRPDGHITFRWKNWGPDFYSGSSGGPVLEADPPRRFVLPWGTEHPSTITFDLTEEFGGTTVRLTESGYPDSPESRAMMLECAAGWGEALTLLKFYIEHGIIYTPPQRQVC